MSSPILVTKFFIPQPHSELIKRPRLIEQLDEGLHRKLMLISAPAGFGKTTLVTDFLQSQGDDLSSPFLVAWLSLDEGDNDAVRFLIYLFTSLNRIQGLETEIGAGALQMIQAPQPPAPETIMIALINEVSLLSEQIILILDNYHLIDSQQVHESLNFLIENLPPQLHLVITTWEEVAATLFISANTVKTHARNIYSKLGVHKQLQAVRKAQGLDLLEQK